MKSGGRGHSGTLQMLTCRCPPAPAGPAVLAAAQTPAQTRGPPPLQEWLCRLQTERLRRDCRNEPTGCRVGLDQNYLGPGRPSGSSWRWSSPPAACRPRSCGGRPPSARERRTASGSGTPWRSACRGWGSGASAEHEQNQNLKVRHEADRPSDLLRVFGCVLQEVLHQQDQVLHLHRCCRVVMRSLRRHRPARQVHQQVLEVLKTEQLHTSEHPHHDTPEPRRTFSRRRCPAQSSNTGRSAWKSDSSKSSSVEGAGLLSLAGGAGPLMTALMSDSSWNEKMKETTIEPEEPEPEDKRLKLKRRVAHAAVLRAQPDRRGRFFYGVLLYSVFLCSAPCRQPATQQRGGIVCRSERHSSTRLVRVRIGPNQQEEPSPEPLNQNTKQPKPGFCSDHRFLLLALLLSMESPFVFTLK